MTRHACMGTSVDSVHHEKLTNSHFQLFGVFIITFTLISARISFKFLAAGHLLKRAVLFFFYFF